MGYLKPNVVLYYPVLTTINIEIGNVLLIFDFIFFFF